MSLVLEVVQGRKPDRYEITGKTITIGRSDSNDIILDEEGASGSHCQVILKGKALFIEDLGSKNGTFLNGERIKKVPFYLEDVIQIGESYIKISNDHLSVVERQMLSKPVNRRKNHVDLTLPVLSEKQSSKKPKIQGLDGKTVVGKEGKETKRGHHGMKDLTYTGFSQMTTVKKLKALKKARGVKKKIKK